MSARDEINASSKRVREAQAALEKILIETCPGKHMLIQHRDRKPPWCPDCGRTRMGTPKDLA